MAATAEAAANPVDVARPLPPLDERRARALFVAAVIVAIVPLVIAAVRAWHDHAVPIGDDAYFELRARDVFSHHIPLLGTWTSASQSTGTNLNNPGPLYFYLLAAPVKLFNHAGLILGVLLINVAAVAVTAWFAFRRGGALVGAAAMAMAAGLGWTMGSDLVIDAWQPHAMLLPFLCCLVLVWSLACGDLVALPVTAFVSSFIVQTHLSYAVLVPVLTLWGLVAIVLRIRRRAHGWRDARSMIVLSGVIAFVCWLPPIIEELRYGSDGNLSRILSTIGKAKDTIGLGFGVRLVSAIVSVPPWWLRPSFGDAFVPVTNHHPGIAVARNMVPSIGIALLTLAVLAALVVVSLRHARHVGDNSALMLLVTAVIAVVGAVLNVATLPIGFFGIAPHQLRFLWPISIFILFAIVVTWARAVTRPPAVLATGVALAVASVLAVLNLPADHEDAGPSADRASMPSTKTLLDQLGPLTTNHTLLFDVNGLRFAEPYSVPVFTELDRRGVEIKFSDEGMVRQVGPERQYKGGADGRLFELEGDAAVQDQPGASRVAIAYGLSPDEQAERLRLKGQLQQFIASGQLRLTPAGAAAVQNGDLPELAIGADPKGILLGRRLGDVLALHYLDLPPEWRTPFERFAELDDRWDTHTVALFLAPA